MKTSFYREKWSELKAQTIAPQEFRRLARQIAYAFMDAYLKDCHYESDYIDLLCEMTTFSADPSHPRRHCRPGPLSHHHRKFVR